MFAELFFKECKLILKCTTYYVLILCIFLFYSSQKSNFNMVEKPQPGQEDYGIAYSTDENVIMEKSLNSLVREYTQNCYVTYPIGFYKTVTLNENKQSGMAEIIARITGLEKEKAISSLEEYRTNSAVTAEQLQLTVAESMTYEQFRELMKQADKLLGGGSNYSNSYLMANAQEPKTYEEALQEYNDILKKDHLSGAFARLFSDYMGIVLTILPIFLAITRGLRDKRAWMNQIIYSRRASSFTIIMSRYLSMIVMVLLPIIILGCLMTIQCIYNGITAGVTIDYFAFAKYIFGWLLPAIMISTSVGVLITELTESAIGIVVMGFWWFASLFMGIIDIHGGYGWNLMPRHNTLGNYQVYQENYGILAANRVTYSLIAVLLIIIAVAVYDRKRRGKLTVHGKISSNRKSKSEI